MARIRTIKPSFWSDEDLSEVSAETALLAIGLLNHADDEGYFKAHPGLVRAAVFPIRETTETVSQMMETLENTGYIVIFTGTDGKAYGYIKNFSKHQKINRPNPSEYKHLIQFTDDSLSDHGTISDQSLPEGKGRGKERNKEGRGREGGGVGGDFTTADVRTTEEQKPPARQPCPHQKIIDLYHDTLPTLKPVGALTSKQADELDKRWSNGMGKIDSWKVYFDDVAHSKFLLGEKDPPPGRRKFKADFNFLIRKETITKTQAGDYFD